MGVIIIEHETVKNIFIFLTIFAFAVALYLTLTNELPLAVGFISIAIACISITLGMDSFKLGKESKEISEESKQIALESKELAEKSDARVNDIANANFLGIVSIFEDKRLDIQFEATEMYIQLGYSSKRRIFLWKCLIYLRQAKELLEFCKIEKRHRTRLMNVFNNLIDVVIPIREHIVGEELEHILEMYLIVLDLKVDNQLKRTAKENLRLLLDLRRNIRIGKRYIRRLRQNITRAMYEHPMIDNIEAITNV